MPAGREGGAVSPPSPTPKQLLGALGKTPTHTGRREKEPLRSSR